MLVHVCDRVEVHGSELVRATAKEFGVDDQALEIDLCAECEKALLEALAEFLDNARSVRQLAPPIVRRRPRTSPKPPPTVPVEAPAAPVVEPAAEVSETPPPSGRTSREMSREERGEVRSWANANGYYVQPRGSIAQRIIDAFYARVGSPA